MMYKKETGFAAIRQMEPDAALKAINEALESMECAEFAIEGAVNCKLTARKDASLRSILEEAGCSSATKFVHFGAPVGVILSKNDLNTTAEDILSVSGAAPGSLTIYVGDSRECSVHYILGILGTLNAESCGRCVLCRLGIDQLIRIIKDAVSGKGRPDDLDTLRTLASSMRKAAYCRFGKGVGALMESYCEGFAREFEEHARKKQCSAMVCEKYLQYIILPNLCDGCGDCMDECDEDAIQGKRGYIHMIDDLDCSRCGKCVKVCDNDAITLAGANKPKLPVKLTRVGAWRGR